MVISPKYLAGIKDRLRHLLIVFGILVVVSLVQDQLLLAGHGNQKDNINGSSSLPILSSERLTHFTDFNPNETIQQVFSSLKRPLPWNETPTFAVEVFHPNETSRKVCRFHNACFRRSDGALLIHPQLNLSSQLLNSCGITSIDFFNTSGDYIRHESNTIFDFFDISQVDPHIPHFVLVFLPAVAASEMVWSTAHHPNLNRSCILPSSSSATCPKTTSEPKGQSALLVDPRVTRVTISSWLPQITALIRGTPFLLSTETLFEHAERNHITCVNSVVRFRVKEYDWSSDEWYDGRSSFYNKNGLNRQSLLQSNSNTRKNTCDVRVLIMNRSIGGRRFIKPYEMKQTIIDQVRKEKSLFKKKVNVDVSIEYFENHSFSQQVQIVQKADVIVAPHGAGLSNLIFAKKDTPVLEVFSFLYYGTPFRAVAQVFGLKHSTMMSEPEEAAFLNCLNETAQSLKESDFYERGSKLFYQAVHVWSEWKVNKSVTLLDTANWSDSRISQLRVCARSQYLDLNLTEVAEYVVGSMIRSICPE